MAKKKQKLTFRDVALTLLGSLILALGIYLFTEPNQIAPGGVSGLATVINFLTGAPIGTLTAVINLPLLILGWFFLGRAFILKTILSVASFAVIYDYALPFVPQYVGNPLLASIFGGALLGLGLGVSFLCDGSTGGLDIANLLIQLRFPSFKISTLMFATDAVIVIFSAFAYQNIDTAMYALIAMFVQTKLIDVVLYGADLGKMVMIVTQKGEAIARQIMENLERGVTKIPSVGAYSNASNETLLCAVRRNEYYMLHKIVVETDPNAFMIVTTAAEVVGYGFKEIEEDT